MKMINTILLSIILLFVCCSKENTSKELFPLSYILVVNDYNNNLKSFNFFTRTYYPDENEMIIYGSGKSKERKITDDRYLHQYDSFVFSPNQFVYRGCITYMELHFDYLDSIGVVSRKYFLTDTIKNNQTVLFVWPNDTIFANKL